MHEFVLSGAPMKRELRIRTLDLAKRLLDHGVHPPTVYFPLLVDEALLIEPTETETRETLDAFAEAIAAILARGGRGPGDRPQRAVHDAGAAPRRGGGGEAAGHPAAAGRGVERLRASRRPPRGAPSRERRGPSAPLKFGAWGRGYRARRRRGDRSTRALDAGRDFLDSGRASTGDGERSATIASCARRRRSAAEGRRLPIQARGGACATAPPALRGPDAPDAPGAAGPRAHPVEARLARSRSRRRREDRAHDPRLARARDPQRDGPSALHVPTHRVHVSSSPTA